MRGGGYGHVFRATADRNHRRILQTELGVPPLGRNYHARIGGKTGLLGKPTTKDKYFIQPETRADAAKGRLAYCSDQPERQRHNFLTITCPELDSRGVIYSSSRENISVDLPFPCEYEPILLKLRPLQKYFARQPANYRKIYPSTRRAAGFCCSIFRVFTRWVVLETIN
jgi:hypothetical protein